VLSIKEADFSWAKLSTEPTLEGIDLTVKKGELVGILGRVGAGKTSLLSAIIGDMLRKEGDIVLSGSVSYAPQNPWSVLFTLCFIP
jgi:ATP-binding cassette subfamily C (CFTR/MRP) protein 1